jgi:hypothetical protein
MVEKITANDAAMDEPIVETNRWAILFQSLAF